MECAKLLDFGISKSARIGGANGPESDLTLAGTVMGTIQYLSPEQAMGLQATPASDLWALGVVMFEMLAGVCAFDSQDSAQDTLFQIASGPPPQLSHVAPHVPWALAEVVQILMKREPIERFKDVDEFIAALVFAAKRIGVHDSLVGDHAQIPLTHTASEMRALSSFALMSSNSKMDVLPTEKARVRSESQVQKRRAHISEQDTIAIESLNRHASRHRQVRHPIASRRRCRRPYAGSPRARRRGLHWRLAC